MTDSEKPGMVSAQSPQSAREHITRYIRTVPDWPAPGVLFQDITPLLLNPEAFRAVIEVFLRRYSVANDSPMQKPDLVAERARFYIGSGGGLPAGYRVCSDSEARQAAVLHAEENLGARIWQQYRRAACRCRDAGAANLADG